MPNNDIHHTLDTPYAGLVVWREKDKYFWSVEDSVGGPAVQEIDKELFDMLVAWIVDNPQDDSQEESRGIEWPRV